ncbi:hypothetical protein [Bacillus sp. MUM 116]|uniref:hypothetical protein n=1 Tax=Bacillus sp. MUM 116 TaxID=1678002 RepID=UPI00210DA23C|nr:hypothetical protein [Bacillus sp. MUM 116]
MGSINEKLTLLQNEIKKMGGIIDLGWCGELLYPFYEHFNDDNLRYRAGCFLGTALRVER